MCSTDRMEKAVSRAGFIERIFSSEEIGYAEKTACPAEHFAAAFAAREALSKAGGWGIFALGFSSASVTRTDHGPEFVFSDDFAAKLSKENITSVFLSITHEGGMAAAMVVLEGD